jgi:diacylglycerol kinase (ATP)
MFVAAQLVAQAGDVSRGIVHALIYNLTRNLGESTITNYRQTVLIYNRFAGNLGRQGGALERAAEVLRKAGHNLIVAPTAGPGTATRIAREQVRDGADLVLAAGGDGTINEVAEGLVHTQVPLGILPGGTANVLATELGLGSRLVRGAERLPECRPYRISVGHVSCEGGTVSRHFLLMAGAGLDAHIVYQVSLPLKARTGKLAYWVAGWGMLGRHLAEFRVELPGGERQCSFALVSKVRNYGGDLEIAREASLFDAHFEVILFEGRSTLPYLKYLFGVMMNRLHDMKGVTISRAECLKFSAPKDQRIYVQVDGEFAGHLPAYVKVVPDALTLLVPDEYARQRHRSTAMADSDAR